MAWYLKAANHTPIRPSISKHYPVAAAAAGAGAAVPFAGGWRKYQGSSPNPDPVVALGAAASALGTAVSASTLSQPSARAPWGVTRPLGGSVCAFQAHLARSAHKVMSSMLQARHEPQK